MTVVCYDHETSSKQIITDSNTLHASDMGIRAELATVADTELWSVLVSKILSYAFHTTSYSKPITLAQTHELWIINNAILCEWTEFIVVPKSFRPELLEIVGSCHFLIFVNKERQ